MQKPFDPFVVRYRFPLVRKLLDGIRGAAVLAAILEQRRQALFQRSAGNAEFLHRKNLNNRSRGLRLLAEHVEFAHGIDGVAEKLDAYRAVAEKGIDVDDAAADAERADVLDHGFPAETVVHEPHAERFDGNLVAHLQPDDLVEKVARRQDFLHERGMHRNSKRVFRL